MKYEIVKLGDYLYIKGRIGWKGLKKSEYLDYSNYRIINGESLTENGIDWGKAGFITEERYNESPEIMLQLGDILLSKDGTIGKIGYVSNLDKPTTVASGIFVIRNIKPQIINTRFIYYYLCSREFKNFVTMRTEGSVIPHLYQKDFIELDFPLPSLALQEKIVSILDSISDKINLNKSINDNLRLLAA
ncbi:MAG: restriction endonuclease subunit S [Firmicutes bacterium]|nr:restriction endonuclease subunit S [Bacillota bacterium]